jgi:hypothetical protein
MDKRTRWILTTNGFTLRHGPLTIAMIDRDDLCDNMLIVQLPDGTRQLMIETRNGCICADIVDLREGPRDIVSCLRGLMAGPPERSGEQAGT